MPLVHDHLGNAIQGLAANADMAPSDRLLQVAGELYLYDDSVGKPVLVSSARNLGAGSSGQRLLPIAPFLGNGAGFDPALGNVQGTLLASASRTVQTATADQTNFNHRGLMLFFNVSAASGTGGLTLYLQAKDPVSSNYVTMCVLAAAATTTGQRAYLVYPGAATAGALAAPVEQALPRTWRVLVDVGDASVYGYSLGYALIR